MKDIFGNNKPVQIETNEWWFNGRIIIKQNDFRLPNWISFFDKGNSEIVTIHSTKAEAVKFAIKNPCCEPQNFPKDYIGH
jgi:hypothetical protein